MIKRGQAGSACERQLVGSGGRLSHRQKAVLCDKALSVWRGWRQWLMVLCLVSGLSLNVAGWGVYIKATAAQWLMAHAWQRSVEIGAPVRPWRQADFRVAARLQVPALGVDQFALEGGSAAALAYAPTLQTVPGSPGVRVISAHRDSHFRFVGQLAPGSLIELSLPHQRQAAVYRVSGQWVVDSRDGRLPIPGPDALLLSTCYPLNAWAPGGNLRLVTAALPVEPRVAGSMSI